MRNHRSTGPQGRPKGAPYFLFDLLILVLPEWFGPNRAANAVYRDIDAAKGFDCVLHQTTRPRRSFQVSNIDLGKPARSQNFVSHFPAVLIIDVCHHD